MSIGDVASHLLTGDVERPLGHLRGQHARDAADLDRWRAAALGVAGLPGAGAEARGGNAGEAEGRPAAQPLLAHAASVSLPPEKSVRFPARFGWGGRRPRGTERPVLPAWWWVDR